MYYNIDNFTTPKCNIFCCKKLIFNFRRTVSEWHEKGIRVIAWTVNAPAEKQYFAKVLKITYMTDTLTGENTVHTK